MKQLALRWKEIVFCLLGGLALAGCSTAPGQVSAASEIPPVSDSYKLVAGDKLRVNVFGERDLSGEYQVESDGAVNVALIGKVPAAGLTGNALEEQLTKRYGNGYLVNPKIVVEVFDQRPFFVVGEVNKPGSFPLSDGLTLRGAVAVAGDFSYRANQRIIYLRRGGSDKEYVVDPNSPVYVGPGDVIRVSERHF